MLAHAAITPSCPTPPQCYPRHDGCAPVGLDCAGQGGVLGCGAVDCRAVLPVENSLCDSTHRVLRQEEPHRCHSSARDMVVVAAVAEQRGEEREEGRKKTKRKEMDGKHDNSGTVLIL